MSRPLFDPSLQATVAASGVIAVLVVSDESDAVPLARALLAGGVTAMELTLRTPAAIPALRRIKAEVTEMIAGVGTILSPGQVEEAQKAGADFGVSPGINARVLQAAAACGLSFAPGIATPSDLELAVENGCRLLKFFPCEPLGGLKYLKVINAPFAHLGLSYIPLGGLNDSHLTGYLADPLVCALGGSWLADKPLIDARDWATITLRARRANELIAEARLVQHSPTGL